MLWDGGGIEVMKKEKMEVMPKSKEMGLFLIWFKGQKAERVSNFVVRVRMTCSHWVLGKAHK